MDAVEVARQIASRLHEEAVKAGKNPWSPYAFAVAEANRREIDVEAIGEGATQLNGARATYSARDQLILHEDKGTDFEKAFLVAHEVGHAELGGPANLTEIFEIDPERSAEASPIGMERVIDYSHKQRLEVQMDLFAREFLLPRKFVKGLHLNEGLSAEEIAKRIGANFEIVAQQLLDALLLPEVVLPAKEASGDRPPNPEQRSASCYLGNAYLLEAGPGTGKTQTLITRVEFLLSKGVNPERILLLTFSNKAAGEMALRLAALCPEAAAAMTIGTFHAFGLDIIRRFNDQLGFPKNPRLLDRTEAVEMLEEEFHRLNLVHFRDIYDSTSKISDILTAISRAKDEVVNAGRYHELAAGMLANATGEEEQEHAHKVDEIARVYLRYEEIKRARSSLDFGDLVLLPALLLEQNEAVRSHLQQLYDHVLVDEYQDVNRSSVRLLTALKPDGQNLWVVGDPKQSIYRFRGASSFNVARFGAQDFPGGQRGRLEQNYRSTPEIVSTYSTFAAGMQAIHDNPLTPIRESSGTLPELQLVEGGNQLPVAVADNIERLREQGYSYSSQAVLCGGNERLASIAAQLESLGVPVLFLGSLFERREIKDLLSLLSILTDRRAAGMLRLASWPEFRMSMEDVVHLFSHLKSNQISAGAWMKNPEEIPEISPDGIQAIERINAALRGFSAESSPWKTLCAFLLDRTRRAAEIATSPDVTVRAQGIAIWQFMNFLRSQPKAQGLPIVRLLNRVRRLILLGDDRDLRQMPDAAAGLDAVRLMTIHGSKGLEFDVIHLPGMSRDTLPTPWRKPNCPIPHGMIEGAHETAEDHLRNSHEQEQECLFYVALSRARDQLCFYAAKRKSDGKNRPVTPYLDRLQTHIRANDVMLTRDLPPAAEDAPIALELGENTKFTDSELDLYERCPRRFLYTHILKTGGKRQQTGLMLMHDAVRQVCQQLIGVDTVEESQLRAIVENALQTAGLADHGYIDDYKTLASDMLGYLQTSRQGRRSGPGGSTEIRIGGHSVHVKFDETLTAHDGQQVIRRIRSGHYRKSHEDDLTTAAFLLMGNEHFPSASLEIAYLADAKPWRPEMSERKLGTRSCKLQDSLNAIQAGQFEAERSTRTCPNCPAFFVCGEVPSGKIPKKVI